jgi:hypothetical protein
MNHFEKIKHLVVIILVLSLPNIQQSFKIKLDAYGNAMGTILMQHKTCHQHFKTFSGIALNFQVYDCDMYALV